MAVSHKKHSHPEEETEALRLRMRRIVGQLQGVERMLEAERDCIEILTQIISIRRGLKSLSEQLIHEHLQHCLLADPNERKNGAQLREILDLLDRYVE